MAHVYSTTDITSIYVLVDWDNLQASFTGRNNGEEVAYQLRQRIVHLKQKRFASVQEIEIRCYSAWLNGNGTPTNQGSILRPQIEDLSFRCEGVPVVLRCVDGLVLDGAPQIFSHLVGPRDCRCSARKEVFEQKMVDTLITTDVACLAEYPDIGVVVVSDDVDMAPGIAVAGMKRAELTGRTTSSEEVRWLRRRPQTRQTRMLAKLATVEEW